MLPNRWTRIAERNRLEIWDMREPCPEDLAAAWRSALDACAHARFALDLEYLGFDSRLGHLACVLRHDGHGGRGLMVQRSIGGCWVSAWPWRWQAPGCGADPGSPIGMTAVDLAWLHDHASHAAGSHTAISCLSHLPIDGCPGGFAGATVLHHLFHCDEDLSESPEPSKRGLVRRGLGLELEVVVAKDEQNYREFHRLQRWSRQRRGLQPETTPERVNVAGILPFAAEISLWN